MEKVNKKSRLNNLRISNLVNLDTLTRGEGKPYRSRLWGTTSQAFVDDNNQYLLENLPEEQRLAKWKIAYNFQQLSETVIDPVITSIPQMKIFRGYKNPAYVKKGSTSVAAETGKYDKHFTGEAVDLYIPGKNMFHYVNDIYEIVKDEAVEVGLVYGGVSWVHVGINGKYGPDVGTVVGQRLFTADGRTVVVGFMPLRGLS